MTRGRRTTSVVSPQDSENFIKSIDYIRVLAFSVFLVSVTALLYSLICNQWELFLFSIFTSLFSGAIMAESGKLKKELHPEGITDDHFCDKNKQ